MSFSGEQEPRHGATEQLPSSAEEALAKAKQAVDDASAAHLAFFQEALQGSGLNEDQKILVAQLQGAVTIASLEALLHRVVYPDPPDPDPEKNHYLREYFPNSEAFLAEVRGKIEVLATATAAFAEAQKRVEAEQQEAKRAQEKAKIEAGHVMSFPGGWPQIQAEANRYQGEAKAHFAALHERMDRPIPTPANLFKAPLAQEPLPGSGQKVGMWNKNNLPLFQGGAPEQRVDDPAAVVGPEVQTMIMPEQPKPPSLGDRFKSLAKKLFG